MTTPATIQRGSFSITGEALTTIARDFVLSQEFSRAESFLVEGLVGITHDLVHQVLSGHSRMVGNSRIGIDLEEDPDKDYQEQVNYIYAGRRRFSHTWWKPVAYWKWTSKAIIACNYDLNSRTNHFLKARLSSEEIEGSPSESRDHQHSWVSSFGLFSGEALRRVPWEEELYSIKTEGKPEWTLSGYAGEVLVFFESCDAPPPWLLTKALRQTPFQSFLDALRVGRLDARDWGREHEPLNLPRTLMRASSFAFGGKRTEPSEWLNKFGQETTPKEEWPIWDGTGAAPAPPPKAPAIPDLDSFLTQMDKEVSEEQLAHAKEQIRLQADESGWIEFPRGNEVLRVPKGAFECWALRRTPWRDRATPWKVMTGESWKQYGDDPYHTDWMLGAGLDLGSWKADEILQTDAYHATHRLQAACDPRSMYDSRHEYEEFGGTILVCPRSSLSGAVIHPEPNKVWHKQGGDQKVIVLPNLNPK